MMAARLLVNPSTVRLRASGPATGEIVLMLGDVAFPSPGWNDFVVVVLEAWIGALVRLARNASAVERVYFMEGAYAVDIARLRSGVCELRLIERPARQYELAETSLLSLLDNAAAVADTILEVCRGARGSRDVDGLTVALASLQEEKRRLASQ